LAADELSEDKRVEVMLLRLEEAIAAGQFDKAAVLAKELAAIKRIPSAASPAASPVRSGCCCCCSTTIPAHEIVAGNGEETQRQSGRQLCASSG
jgi:hypothetical protein